jgi:DNA-binding MarR family transcriptional regulator
MPMTREIQTDVGQLRAGIRALVRRFSVSERADVQCCGMTVAQAATVEALRGGELRLGTLSQRLGIAPSTLTRNLKRLEEAGTVERVSDADDGRAFRVGLTPHGRRTAASLEVMEDRFAAAVLDRLPTERRRRALDGLVDLLAAVRAETEACCAGAYDHLMDDGCCATPTRANKETS